MGAAWTTWPPTARSSSWSCGPRADPAGRSSEELRNWLVLGFDPRAAVERTGMTAPKRLRGRPITSAGPPDVRLIRACWILDSWAWAVDQEGAMLSGALATTRDRRMSGVRAYLRASV